MAHPETGHTSLRPASVEPVDATAIFLEQAAKHRILTPIQERALGGVVQRGLAAEYRRKTHPEDRNPQLDRHIRQRKRAQKYLVDHNIRLLVSEARKFVDKSPLPLEDLIQEGSFGLIRAAGKYNPEKGAFISFAGPAIRNAIIRGIADTAHAIRIPQDESRKMKHVHYLVNTAPVSDKSPVVAVAKHVGIPPERVERYLAQKNLHTGVTSIDSPVGDGEDTIVDYLPTPRSLHPEHVLEVKERNTALELALNALTPKQREIVVTRYFTGPDGEEQPFETIAKALGYKDKQSTHQSHANSMKKLKGILKEMPEFV